VKRAALIVLALAALIPLRAGASGATFVAATANPGATFGAAADFNTVSVALTDPGTNLRGTIALAATAASDRGIATVRFQTTTAGGSTWTDACTATVAPYTCAFDTTTVADGLRDIRAVATDTAGYARTAAVSSRRIDNIAPTTSLTDPGAVLTGTKTISATAADAGSGLASIKLQYRVNGGSTWTDICATTSCSLNTATLADGLYDFRSLATDTAGNTNTSVVSARRMDNTAPTASLSSLPAYVRATISLAATLGDGNGAGITTVNYQMRVNGTSTWNDACTVATAPFSCTGDTSSVPDGLYDVRAIATDGAGFTTTSGTVTTRVDNTAPSAATLTNPGTNLSGTLTLSATAADAGSGIASVAFQSAPTGTSTWTTICTDSTSSYSCAWNTTTLTDAVYDLRVVATDNAGNTLNSTALTAKRVDNNGPTLTFTNPGTLLRGTVALAATATDPAGVTSVTFQHKLSTAGTWTTSCTADTISPYACSLSTTTLTSGQNYDFRTTSLDTLGHSSTSPTYTAKIDNTAPTGTSVQAVNGSGTAGRIDAGDTLTFGYSEAMAPASILAGWDGSAVAVTVHVTNSSTTDLLSIYNGTDTTKLNLTGTTDLQLKANRVTATAKFAATMTMSGNTVVITFGSLTSGSTSTVATTTPMVWTPSASATDLAGNACATSTVTESGTDADF
jgi:chitinase